MDSRKILYSAGKNDECYTPSYAVRPLLQYLEPFKGKTIWCPFDTVDSQFVKVLRAAGHNVVFSHIKTGQDYFEYEPEHWDLIVSNPPFTGKRQIFERALSFNKPFALLMSLTWLNDSAPKQLFVGKDLQLLMFDRRIKFGQGNKITFSSAYYCVDILPKQIVFEQLKEQNNDTKNI